MNERDTIFQMLNLLSEQLDRATVVELVDLYADNSVAALARMNRLAAGESPRCADDFLKEAHALKSSSANLGAQALSRLCLELEKSAQIDASTAGRLELARQAHGEALRAMREWCAG